MTAQMIPVLVTTIEPSPVSLEVLTASLVSGIHGPHKDIEIGLKLPTATQRHCGLLGRISCEDEKHNQKNGTADGPTSSNTLRS